MAKIPIEYAYNKNRNKFLQVFGSLLQIISGFTFVLSCLLIPYMLFYEIKWHQPNDNFWSIFGIIICVAAVSFAMKRVGLWIASGKWTYD